MSADFEQLRIKMVDGQLRTTDVTNLPILEAFLSVPREAFVPARLKELAYIDEDVDITPPDGEARRFLMEPSPLAKLIQLADIETGDVVLDVGTGTGYAAAILSQLAGSVIALESDAALAAQASERLSELGCDNVAVVEGALEAGYPSEAPYDVILVAGAVDRVPDTLFEQMKDGGRLVTVEGHGNAGVARLYLKQGDHVSGRWAFNAAVKPLPGFQAEPAFEF
ncbi:MULTISPECIES: protein-L-isoaspartate O-methyltransferase family protein [Nitratireductor]|uniref:protein-L-isoaspartate O-methyltransferase family protein n=1 Tax=Nitratireductor TaxID=245876 RepID=UPI000D0CE68B|nr:MULTISPECIES: protein-L-isoaspartate O-methyltransferase [Nitratireductor]PSM18022.1 protein-L-isoaspartate O-methyltransferase [Nitratireductor sp. StC3]